jgi:hypothetical protein
MSPGAITIDQDATKPARNGDFVGIKIGGDRSCSVVIGSRLAAISAMLDLPRWHQIAKVVRGF